MDAFPESQNFLDGLHVAKRHNCEEEYTQVFLQTYKLTGDIKYSKNNALRVAMHERDTEILEINI